MLDRTFFNPAFLLLLLAILAFIVVRKPSGGREKASSKDMVADLGEIEETFRVRENPDGGEPFVSGTLVKGHIDLLREKGGEEKLRELERRYIAPILTGQKDEVPVRDEACILDLIAELLHPGMPKGFQENASGRFHFESIMRTPAGRTVFLSAPEEFKSMMVKSRHTAERLFRNIRFEVADIGSHALSVELKNTAYPLHHMKGFFEACMEEAGIVGRVAALEVAPRECQYKLSWSPTS